MAGASEIRAGRAFVEIAAKDKGFAAGLDKAAKRLKAFGKTVTMIGGAVTAFAGAGFAVLGKAIASFTESGSNLVDMAARTGASVEALSALGYAAGQTGASLDDVEKAMRKAAKAGIGPDKFEETLAAIAAIPEPAARAAKAMEVFGKSGTKLLPMGAELAALTAEAKALGLVMSGEDAKAADKLGDAWDRLKATGSALQNIVGAALAESLTKLLDSIQRIATKTIQWVNSHRKLVVSMAQGLGVIGAFGVALTAVGLAITAAGIGLAFLLTPIGAVVAGMLAGAAAAALLLNKVGMLGPIMEQLGAAFNRAWGGIKDALMAGDLELAWKIVLAGMNVELQKALMGMQVLWAAMKGNVLMVFDALFGGIKIAFLNLMAFLSKGWLEFQKEFGGLDADQANRAIRAITDLTATAVGDALKEMNAAMLEHGIAGGMAGLQAAADLATAQAELQALLDQARRAAATANKPGRMIPPGALQSMLPSGVSSGSFDPNAAAGLGRVSPIQQQTLDVLKDIEANGEEVVSLLKEGGLRFA